MIDHLGKFYWGDTPNNAFGRICSPIDSREDRIQRAIEAEEKYLILKLFYLILLYLSGGDYYAVIHKEDAKNRENFVGRFSWINLDFGILKALERDAFISNRWTSPHSTILTKKGILAAINILRNIVLEEPEQSLLKLKLEDLSYHKKYVAYENQYDAIDDGIIDDKENYQ